MTTGNLYFKGKTTEAGEALLLDYAAGSLNEALSLIVSTHLAMSESSRAFVKQCEDIGGELLVNECEPQSLSSSCLEKILAQLDDRCQKHHEECAKIKAARLDGIYIPSPLAEFMPNDEDRKQCWHKLIKGMDVMDVMNCKKTHSKAQLLRMAPATSAPSHSHAGLEVTLILDGAFSDETGQYQVGDLIVEDETTTHTPVSCPKQGCVCLAVTTAPIRLTGWVGRMINPFLR